MSKLRRGKTITYSNKFFENYDSPSLSIEFISKVSEKHYIKNYYKAKFDLELNKGFKSFGLLFNNKLLSSIVYYNNFQFKTYVSNSNLLKIIKYNKKYDLNKYIQNSNYLKNFNDNKLDKKSITYVLTVNCNLNNKICLLISSIRDVKQLLITLKLKIS